MPEGSAEKPPPGMGTNIIEALAKQLDARLEGFMNTSGLTVSITHTPVPPPTAAAGDGALRPLGH